MILHTPRARSLMPGRAPDFHTLKSTILLSGRFQGHFSKRDETSLQGLVASRTLMKH